LFGVLKQADSGVVDPGDDAPLDACRDVVVGKQEMGRRRLMLLSMPLRAVSKLKDGATSGKTFFADGSAGGDTAQDVSPDAADERFAEASSGKRHQTTPATRPR